MSRTHNELSQVTVTVKPFDTGGNSYVPTTVKYRVDDCTSGRELVAWTDLTPAAIMTIDVPGSANAIINRSRRTPESKVITILTDEGLDSQHYAEYTYRVKDLKFVNGS